MIPKDTVTDFHRYSYSCFVGFKITSESLSVKRGLIDTSSLASCLPPHSLEMNNRFSILVYFLQVNRPLYWVFWIIFPSDLLFIMLSSPQTSSPWSHGHSLITETQSTAQSLPPLENMALSASKRERDKRLCRLMLSYANAYHQPAASFTVSLLSAIIWLHLHNSEFIMMFCSVVQLKDRRPGQIVLFTKPP